MRVLGKTNLKIKEIGIGGIPIQRLNQKEVNEIIKELISCDINFIDTARGYGNSEELIGEAIKNVRDKFIIATKSMSRTYEAMKKDIQISLEKLQTSYIDIYQLHNVPINENIDGALKALLEAKDRGLVRHIGVTTHSVEALEKFVESSVFETIQFPYNIVETQAERIFERAKKNNIGVIVMKPLAGGAIEDGSLALKFVLNNKNISVAIPGVESIEQVRINSSVVAGDYTKQEVEKIKKVKNDLGNDFCRRCGYCMPCPQGINIPFSFLCEGYHERYNLQEWAKERYSAMKVKASQCVECGVCETRCPYELKIREKLKKVVKILEE